MYFWLSLLLVTPPAFRHSFALLLSPDLCTCWAYERGRWGSLLPLPLFVQCVDNCLRAVHRATLSDASLLSPLSLVHGAARHSVFFCAFRFSFCLFVHLHSLFFCPLMRSARVLSLRFLSFLLASPLGRLVTNVFLLLAEAGARPFPSALLWCALPGVSFLCLAPGCLVQLLLSLQVLNCTGAFGPCHSLALVSGSCRVAFFLFY